MKTALMVAEKPSLAASLANILSNGKNSSKKGKILARVTFYTIIGEALLRLRQSQLVLENRRSFSLYQEV
jgi:hypothetical protein